MEAEKNRSKSSAKNVKFEDKKPNCSYARYIATDFISGDFNVNKRISLIVADINETNVEAVAKKIENLYGDITLFSTSKNERGETAFIEFKTTEIVEICPSVLIVEGGKLTSHKKFDFYDLVEIMKKLRAENGCEWDRAQTHKSIKINLIEEAYELVDAIDHENTADMLEESGDVLLQSVFHTEIAEENGEFDFSDMTTALCRKLIDRHTHIFGENHANNADEALVFWNEAKKVEKKYTSQADAMQQVPKNLPSLLYAAKLQKRSKSKELDFASAEDAIVAIKNSFAEFSAIADSLAEFPTAEGDSKKEVSVAPADIKKEVSVATADSKKGKAGKLLFDIVNALRYFKIEPEIALRDECDKFLNSFADKDNK
ncbi:MAG: MazG family protein [Clostridia bacterium]